SVLEVAARKAAARPFLHAGDLARRAVPAAIPDGPAAEMGARLRAGRATARPRAGGRHGGPGAQGVVPGGAAPAAQGALCPGAGAGASRGDDGDSADGAVSLSSVKSQSRKPSTGTAAAGDGAFPVRLDCHPRRPSLWSAGLDNPAFPPCPTAPSRSPAS